MKITDNKVAYGTVIVVLIMFLALLLASCSKEDDSSPQPSLYGKWEPVEYIIINEATNETELRPIEIYMDFMSNKQVSEKYMVDGIDYGTDTTTYEKWGDSLSTRFVFGKIDLTFSTLKVKHVVWESDKGEEKYILTTFKRP